MYKVKRFVVIDADERVCCHFNCKSYNEAMIAFDRWLTEEIIPDSTCYQLLEVSLIREEFYWANEF